MELALLCRPPLWPDETLASYLHRLALANGYQPPTILTRLCHRRLAALELQDDVTRPRHIATLTVLATLTGCTPQALTHASPDNLAQAPWGPTPNTLAGDSPAPRLSPHQTTRYLRSATNAQFCPDCLRQVAYQRRAWLLRDVSGCLQHGCRLVTVCPHCFAQLRMQDVVTRHCGQCDTDLTAPTGCWRALAPLDLTTEYLLQTWWGVAPPGCDSLAVPLPAQPPALLYPLFIQLRKTFQTRLWPVYGWFFWQGTQTHACQALAHWPMGFHTFLQECLHYDVYQHSYHHVEDFSQPVYLTRQATLATWVAPKQLARFSFIQEPVARFLEENDLQVQGEGRFLRIRVATNAKLHTLAQPIAQRHRAEIVEIFEKMEKL